MDRRFDSNALPKSVCNFFLFFFITIYILVAAGSTPRKNVPQKCLQGPANGPTDIYKLYLDLFFYALKHSVLGSEGFGRGSPPPPPELNRVNMKKNRFAIQK